MLDLLKPLLMMHRSQVEKIAKMTANLARAFTARPTLRGAVIGCGWFAMNHLHAWKAIDGVDIVALCDPDAARVAEARHVCGNVASGACFDDAAQLVARAPEIGLDFVDIVTTAEHHLPLVELAAGAGLATICQKPMAPTMSEAEAMVRACDRAAVPLMIHENWRWQSGTRALRDLVASGRLGKPFFCQVSFRTPYDVYRDQPYLAEGERFIIEDLGVHLLDCARCFMGEVASLRCQTQRVNPAIVGEDVATILMEHESGGSSIVDCSYATAHTPDPFPRTWIQLEGDKATARLGLDFSVTVFDHSASGSGAAEPEFVTVPPVQHPWSAAPGEAIQDSVVNIQQHWVQCLRGDSAGHDRGGGAGGSFDGRYASAVEPETSGRDNLRTLALVEAAYLSAASGSVVQLDP